MYVVDASVWVSRFIRSDPHHGHSRRWLLVRIRAGEPLVAPVIVLAEVAGAISRQTSRPELGLHAAALMERIPSLELAPIDRELGKLAVRRAAELRLRGADAVYVALASRLGAPLVTLDRDQGERGRAVVEVLGVFDSP